MVVGTVSAQQTQCPKVFFNQFGNDYSIECNTDGNVIVDLYICPGYVGAYELDSVVWNMGDGTIVSTDVLQINYTYTSSNLFNVTAIAYFTINGSTCSTEAAVLHANNLLCSNIDAYPSSFWHYGISISVLMLSADLYPSTASVGAVIYPNTPVSLKLDHQGIYPLYSLNYKLLIDGLVVVQGTNVAASGANVYPATTYPIGQHIAEIVLYSETNRYCPKVLTTIFEVVAPPDSSTNCSECFTFRPDHNKRYWLSAWVKEEVLSQVKTYSNTSVRLTFNGSGTAEFPISPSGEIIDGWQRIAGEFTVPANTTSIDIKLNNIGSLPAYFDDIRIHPFNASMKSYVNDAETFWLVAELDDNNYATFYEYDKEGQLIRIKKETAKGIMTIQESRSSNPKN